MIMQNGLLRGGRSVKKFWWVVCCLQIAYWVGKKHLNGMLVGDKATVLNSKFSNLHLSSTPWIVSLHHTVGYCNAPSVNDEYEKKTHDNNKYITRKISKLTQPHEVHKIVVKNE